jgi:hypothetical protein
MPWRVIALGDQVWHVDALAQRPPNTGAWQLVLSFRAAAGGPGAGAGAGAGAGVGAGKRSFWTPYPLEATSKSSLFIQAERIPDAALSQLLSQRLA